MLAGIKIKPCIPSPFSNNPCLNKLPRSGKPSYVASSWHTHKQEKKKNSLLWSLVWDCRGNKFQEKPALCLFGARLRLREVHLHARRDPIGSAQRYSPRQSDGTRCACKWSSPSGMQVSGDGENTPSRSHPNPAETSECFSKAAGAKEKQMLNFEGIWMHFSLPGRFVGWALADEVWGWNAGFQFLGPVGRQVSPCTYQWFWHWPPAFT